MRIGAARRWRWVAATATLAVAAGLASPAHAGADDGTGRPTTHSNEHTVKGHRLKARPRKTDTKRTQVPVQAAWPKSGTADVAASASPKKAGGLPVWVSAKRPGPVHVRLLDRAKAADTGVDGPVFAVSGAKGPVGVRLDYGAFGQAYGGSYGSRLTLERLPPCALTTPERPECRTATPLPTANDARARTLTATAGADAVLAATTGTSGATTDYKATSLSPSATWQTNLNTGEFAWSYPMRVPGVPGGLTPQVQVSYSSGSVDGRTANTNNQPSWAGEGFDLWPGYIQRGYKACSDDGVPKDQYGNESGDQCWGYDNATLTWNGKGGELIPDGNGKWHLKNDDGSRIEKLTGADNGDNDGEYWRLTTSDGTQYYFGKNHLPGWASGKAETKSAWNVPVYGDDDGEPCHQSAYADSWCRQAWRWNLDYVVDPSGNAIAYYYKTETNYYGRNLKPGDETSYERGGYLDHIEYGLRSDDLFATAPARVDFGTKERCIRATAADCDESNIGAHPEYWQDTPWDLNCASGTECKDDHGAVSPTFWSRKRLTSVTTRVIKPDGSGYRDVDAWSLNHDWGLADIDRDLLLTSITHTGDPAGTRLTLPPTTFTYVQGANRVDKLYDDVPPFIRYRLGSVNDESGGIIDVNYSAQDCKPGDLPTPETNTRRCYPQYWQPAGHDNPIRDWFNKYVVTQVVLTDRTGGAPDQVTNYDYQGGAAWHYDDDDGLTKEKQKTWSQWRGYGTVVETSGGWNDMRSQTDHQFFRGMDGDRLNTSGGTKNVTIADGEGGTYPDTEARQGFELKTIDHLSAGGAVTDKTINTIWSHETARRVRSWGTATANLTGTASTRTLTALDGGSWRETLVKNTFEDTAGLPVKSDDLGDTSTATDDRCTTTDYVRDSGAWMLNYPSEIRTVALACATAPDDLSEQLISDVRTSYDNGAFGDAPTKGDVTKAEKAKSASGTSVSYLTTGTTTYDTYGRTRTVTDALSQTTTTTYTDARGLNTGQQVTGPPIKPGDATSALTTSQVLDPAWGVPTSQTDAGGKVTNLAYDGLGRLTKVWRADRTSSQTPSLEFTYRTVDGAPVAVATKTLNNDGTQQTSYELYDGWLRSRQTQTPGPDGRLVSDTFYGVQGEPERTFAAYPASGAPDTALFGVDQQGAVESQTRYSYDGLGRETLERLLSGNGDGTELRHTTTAYGGDRVTVTPPSGGIPTTTISDARGRTVELRQLKPGGYTSTSYTYKPGGQLASTTGPDGKRWSYDYDLRGRKISAADPDKGTTTYGYDDLDRPTSSTDARGKTVVTTYDPAGRKTGLYEGSASGTQLAGWVYDTARKGQPTSATSYAGGQAYTATYSLYDNLNRPQRTTYSVPSSEGALAGNYLFATGYNLDGTQRSMSYASGGGLTAETVVTSYDEWRRPTKLDGNLGTYVTKSLYDPVGKPLQYQLSATGGKSAWLTYGYEYGTQRLHESRTDRENIAGVDRDAIYHYDDAGDVTSITDTSRAGTDQQCFRYDDLQRLSDAWAQNGGTCATDPSSAPVGGPAGYRASYSYDAAGNRVGEAEYGPSGATLDSRVYGYAGDPGVASAITGHELGAVSQTGANAHAESYAYDKAGNTVSRTVGGSTQTLDWDAAGRLSTVSSDAGDTGYVYDTDGNRLIRRDPAGTTLYLPGTELRLDNASHAVTGTRYYTHGGGVVAMRTAAGVRFLASDAHGTAELQIDGSTQALTQRRFDPFGRPRGTPAGVWTGEKSFVGGTLDPDGLTHLGARDYDPDTGRFISVDPVFDLSDPQSWNGYAYADNNPATLADPTGLCSSDACSEYNRKHHRKDNGDAAAHAGWYYAPSRPSYPVSIPREYDSASPKVRKTMIRLNIVEPLKNSNPAAYRQAMAAFCSEYPGDASCGPQVGADMVADLLGMLPVIGSVIDALHGGSYAARGKYGEGATYLAFLIPVVGDVGEGVKIARDLRSLAKACRRLNSLIAGTLVLMADGTAKAIEKVKVGDKVVATDPKTGKTRSEPVIASFGGTSYKSLVKITVDTDGKRGHDTGVVISTEHHLFWDQTHRAWTRADRLSAGSRLWTRNGRSLGILSVAHAPGHPAVRDLTIASLHTFYIQADTASVLVHNEDDPIDLNGKSYTVWQRGPYRIDIEARNGMKQMHFQEQIRGVNSGNAPKYQYNPESGEFEGMSKSLQKDLAKNYPDFKKKLPQAAAIFDRVIGTCG